MLREGIHNVVGTGVMKVWSTVRRSFHVPSRRNNQSGFAITWHHYHCGTHRLETTQHHHRVRLFDKVRAVMEREQEIDALLHHLASYLVQWIWTIHRADSNMIDIAAVFRIGVDKQFFDGGLPAR